LHFHCSFREFAVRTLEYSELCVILHTFDSLVTVSFGHLTNGVSVCSASVKSEIGGELAASSGVSTPGSVGHDIITEQPRSQHPLQADAVDLSGCDLTSAATDGDEEDILSHSSSQISAVPSDPAMDLNDGTQASSPISDSSQTTTEGPDSAVTPSDSSELVSR
jgi:huntingtin